MTPNPLVKIIGALMAGAFFVSAGASAQEIPEDMLVLNYANCMQNCLDSEGQMTCEVLCGCSVSRFRSELNEVQYTALLEQLNQNELSPENRAFLDETAVQCVAELDALLSEMGLLEPEKGTALPPPELMDEEDEGN